MLAGSVCALLLQSHPILAAGILWKRAAKAPTARAVSGRLCKASAIPEPAPMARTASEHPAQV